jgi:hypothetical protein
MTLALYQVLAESALLSSKNLLSTVLVEAPFNPRALVSMYPVVDKTSMSEETETDAEPTENGNLMKRLSAAASGVSSMKKKWNSFADKEFWGRMSEGCE